MHQSSLECVNTSFLLTIGEVAEAEAIQVLRIVSFNFDGIFHILDGKSEILGALMLLLIIITLRSMK